MALPTKHTLQLHSVVLEHISAMHHEHLASHIWSCTGWPTSSIQVALGLILRHFLLSNEFPWLACERACVPTCWAQINWWLLQSSIPDKGLDTAVARLCPQRESSRCAYLCGRCFPFSMMKQCGVGMSSRVL